MTDQNQTALPGKEPTPVQVPLEAGKQPLQVPVQPLTPDQVAQIVEERVTQVLDKWNREQQGLRKKSEDRVRREVDAQLQSLQSAGVQLTNEQAQLIRQVARQRIEDEYGSQTEEPKPAQQQPAVPTIDVNAEIKVLNQEYGTYIDQIDPEAEELKTILANGGSPAQFLRKYEKKLQEKVKRIGTPPEARIPTLAQTGGAAPSLEAEYQTKLKQIRRGDVTAIDRLQKEYRKKGLKI